MALEVGAAAETVSVEAQAVTVDTSSPTLKTVVDQKRIEELPLNGRNATQLMRLVAGVVPDPRADVTSGNHVSRCNARLGKREPGEFHQLCA